MKTLISIQQRGVEEYRVEILAPMNCVSYFTTSAYKSERLAKLQVAKRKKGQEFQYVTPEEMAQVKSERHSCLRSNLEKKKELAHR